MPKHHLLGISGSLRKGSFNTALLRAARAEMPDGATLSVDTIKGIPVYDGDAETADGIPKAVADLKDKIRAEDPVRRRLIVREEYGLRRFLCIHSTCSCPDPYVRPLINRTAPAARHLPARPAVLRARLPLHSRHGPGR